MDWTKDLLTHLKEILGSKIPETVVYLEGVDTEGLDLPSIGILPPNARSLYNEMIRLINMRESMGEPIYSSYESAMQSHNFLEERICELSEILLKSLQYSFSNEMELFVVNNDWHMFPISPEEPTTRPKATVTHIDSARKNS